MVLVISIKYQHHISNLYNYTFHRAPYINRVFYTRRIILEPNKPSDEFYGRLISDPNYDDRRWGTANFNRPVTEQITIKHSSTGIENYKSFISNFKNRFSSKREKSSDKVAEELKNFIHTNWLKKRNLPQFDEEQINQKSEKDKHPEDLIYWFVNYNSACGTISETSVALLRELGFRTRLMRMSEKKYKEIANHVFLEYYSNESQKWVMFDALENLIPKRNGKPLSALEFFLNPEQEDKFKKTKKKYIYAISNATIWFQINGPIKSLIFLPI